MKAVLCLVAGFAAAICAVRIGGLPPFELEGSGLSQVLVEAALIVTLFCAGVRLAAPGRDPAAWRVPCRLALITMPVTAALVAGTARVLLGLPIGEALLLGAILAPTDAALAATLELPDPERHAATRFALSAEGALTSTLAMPLVLLAIGLEGGPDLGALGGRWLVLDVVWGLAGGALLGASVGTLGARALRRLDSRAEAGWLAALLAATTLASAYGAALLVAVNGLVAALVAGLSFARGGITWRGRLPGPASTRAGVAHRLAAGAERIERLVELAAVVLLGALLAGSTARPALVLFALVVLVGLRPLAARLGIGSASIGARPGQGGADMERQALAWFGMRGVASLYYLSFSLDAAGSDAGELTAVALAVLATSVALHGLTALPLGKRPAGAQGSR